MRHINNIKPLSILNKLLLTWLIACLGFTFQSNAQPGDALDFDGSDDYVNIGDNLIDGYSTLTVTAWIKPNSLSTNSNPSGHNKDQDPIVHKAGASNDNFGLTVASGGIAFYLDNGSSSDKTLNSNSSINTGNWVHIAALYNGSKMEIFINGVSDVSTTYSGSLVNTSNELHIGGNHGSSTVNTGEFEFDGEIDEVRIWNEARTQQEIRDNMHKEISNPGSKSNLVGYYNFDNGSGSTLTDQAGSNDGTLKNSPTWVSSGARVGDKSTSKYAPSSNISGSLNLASSDGDDVDVSITGGNADALKVIMLGNAPSNTSVDNSNLSSGSIQQISQDRYWIVHAVNPDGSFDYDFQYNYNGHSGINNESDLRLVKRADFDASDWDAQSQSPNTSSQYIDLTKSLSNAHFALATKNSNDPLPVELTQFKAQKTGEAVELSWATASETNNSHFLIQKRTKDKWENIGKVLGNGTTTIPQEYKFIDKHPQQGTNYYRLKQVDFDGSYEFSGIRSVNFDQITKNDQLSVEVLENPAQRTLRLSITEDKAGRLPYQLLNSEGAPVKQGNWDLQPGKQQKRIGLYGLPSGVYFLKIRKEDQAILKKVVK